MRFLLALLLFLALPVHALTFGPSSVEAFRTSAMLSVAAATGNTGTITYQWYRSTACPFTPVGGNAISGATAITYTDTGLTANTSYCYAVTATDSLVSVTTQFSGVQTLPSTGSLQLCLAGDSRFLDVYTASGFLEYYLKQVGIKVAINNQSVGATYSAQWVPGQSIYSTALAAFLQTGCDLVMEGIGVNDVNTMFAVPPATTGANIALQVAGWRANGFKVMVNFPYAVVPGSDGGLIPANANTLLLQAQPYIAALADGNNVILGDTASFPFFLANGQIPYLSDGIHAYRTYGANLYAKFLLSAILNNYYKLNNITFFP